MRSRTRECSDRSYVDHGVIEPDQAFAALVIAFSKFIEPCASVRAIASKAAWLIAMRTMGPLDRL
jgi:hypothetical protein